MKIKEIKPNIFLVTHKRQEFVNQTFVRFQEHYENDEFAGKIFTLGEFRQRYIERFGQWSYDTDWAGFNIPSSALKPFYDGLFDPLTSKEKAFLKVFSHLDKPFYVIGMSENGMTDVLEHEISHGLYFTNKKYRKLMDKLVDDIPKKLYKRLCSSLTYRSYAPAVHKDEIQAYLGTMTGDTIGDTLIPEEIISVFRYIRKRYDK